MRLNISRVPLSTVPAVPFDHPARIPSLADVLQVIQDSRQARMHRSGSTKALRVWGTSVKLLLRQASQIFQ